MGPSSGGVGINLYYPYEDGGSRIAVKKKVGTDSVFEVLEKIEVPCSKGSLYRVVAQAVSQEIAEAIKLFLEQRNCESEFVFAIKHNRPNARPLVLCRIEETAQRVKSRRYPNFWNGVVEQVRIMVINGVKYVPEGSVPIEEPEYADLERKREKESRCDNNLLIQKIVSHVYLSQVEKDVLIKRVLPE